MLKNSHLEATYEALPEHSWLLAAAEVDLPLFVPGWEDSTLGNIFAARCLEGKLKPTTVRNGIEYMMELSQWYESYEQQLAFLQVG